MLPMTRGPCAKVAIDPFVVVDFLDLHTEYRVDGVPVRQRKYIHDRLISDSDARVIRRWRGGTLGGATERSVVNLLSRFGLDITALVSWADSHYRTLTFHGTLKHQENPTA